VAIRVGCATPMTTRAISAEATSSRTIQAAARSPRAEGAKESVQGPRAVSGGGPSGPFGGSVWSTAGLLERLSEASAASVSGWECGGVTTGLQPFRAEETKNPICSIVAQTLSRNTVTGRISGRPSQGPPLGLPLECDQSIAQHRSRQSAQPL
jgi:hypothetical protein